MTGLQQFAQKACGKVFTILQTSNITFFFGILFLAFSLNALPFDSSAAIITKTTSRGWFTMGIISGTGTPGEEVVVTYSDGSQQTAYVNAHNKWFVVPPANAPSGRVTAKGSEQTNTAVTTIASLNGANGNYYASDIFIENSYLIYDLTQFNLSGTLTGITTNVGYDPLSSDYATLTGYIPSGTTVTAMNGSDSIDLQFTENQFYTIDLLNIWSTPEDPNSTASFNMAISGLFTYGTLQNPFTGSLSGTFDVFDDSIDTATLALEIIASDVPVSGTVNLISQTVVPEPQTIYSIAIGMAMLLVILSRKKEKR